jgi:hypothetical protein
MNKLLLSLALLLSVGVASSQSSIANGAIVPDFTVTDTDGNVNSLSSLTSAGYHVALNFVFEGCTQCLDKAAFVEESFFNYGCNVEEVYFITIVNGTPLEAFSFEADYDFSFPIAAGSGVVSDYGVGAFPTLVLISPSNVMLNNDIWPIDNANSIEIAFLTHGLNPNPCGIVGCTDSTALNYDSAAVVDDGSCLYPIDLSGFSLTDIYGEPISLSAVLAGGQHILFHFMADWNVFDQDLAPEINDIYTFFGCNNHDVFVVAMNYSNNGNASSIQFVDAYGYLPPMVSIEGGSEGVRLLFEVDAFPTMLLVNPSSEIVGGDIYAGVGNTLISAAVAFSENNINPNSCTTPGCIDTLACNFDSLADTDDGSCDYDCTGCTDPSALNFDSTADTDNGSCVYVDCANLAGTDWSAFNTGLFGPYSEMIVGQSEFVNLAFNMTNALYDPGTNASYPIDGFELQTVTGLPDGIDYQIDGIVNGSMTLIPGEQACVQLTGTPTESGEFNVNFTGQMTIQLFGSWTQLTTFFQHTIMVLPLDGDVVGCTYTSAFNYNPLATIEDGSCIFAGCTNVFALNYSPIATVDDESCILAEGICGPGTYWDFGLQMCVVPPVCVGDLNYDGEISALDLLTLLGSYGTLCE